MAGSYETLRVGVAGGVATVVLDHPPVNLFDGAMIGDLGRLQQALAQDGDVRVVVFRSANPDFFIAHADLADVIGVVRRPGGGGEGLAGIHRFMEGWRTFPKVTIAQLEGLARGGGSEFALALDMRFGAIGRAVLGQPEVAIGIIPGAGGTQRLARLLGRSRAIEAVVGGDDFAAEVAERYGWINRALPPVELGPFVDRLARRIASFPPAAVAAAKRAVLVAEGDVTPDLMEETGYFRQAAQGSDVVGRVERALELGAQTPAGEVDLQRIIEELAG